ncbi:ANTAR domain-containing protein [Streptomyces liliifuscus]|uniref:ANTAR domain-containing protein n=1 Tax=Streptomyces liliifuscus TaxID=2797636 RepID=A0A7T7L3V3_9ACTN|nr:ANTAR domain-containing protein [Streptomyces liliifuscus]QQM45904.1 ANTAR domain-containing protein [Streptomyces liliifuscus]
MTSDAGSKAEEPGGGLPDQAAPGEDAPRIAELQEEIGQLKEAVTSHAVVDQAIGMMVALGRVTPDDGWAVLREVSQHTNIKLRNVAEMILVWGQKGDLPPDVRATLEETLDRYGPTSLPEDSPPLR